MVLVPVAFLLGDDDTFLLRCVMSVEGLVGVLLLACTMGRSPRLLYYVGRRTSPARYGLGFALVTGQASGTFDVSRVSHGYRLLSALNLTRPCFFVGCTLRFLGSCVWNFGVCPYVVL